MLRHLTGQIEGLSVAETIVAGILPRAGVCYRRPGPRLQHAADEQDAEQQRKGAFRANQLPSIFHSPLLFRLSLCHVSLISPVFHGFLPFSHCSASRHQGVLSRQQANLKVLSAGIPDSVYHISIELTTFRIV